MEAKPMDAPLGGLLEVVTNAVRKASACTQNCQRLQNKLDGMKLLLKEVKLSQNHQTLSSEFSQRLLLEGEELVQQCSKVSSVNVFKNYMYAEKIEALVLRIDDFTNTVRGWALNYSELLHVETKDEKVELRMQNIEANLMQNIEANFDTKFEILRKLIEGHGNLLQNNQNAFPVSIPKLPDFTSGLEIPVRDLKERLLSEDVTLIGVVGTGGSGKTTLATALCHDIDVQDYFTYNSKQRIVFEKVSQNPDTTKILESMWLQMVPNDKPNFCDIEDARRHLQEKLCPKEPQPTLVVLDDVWEMHDLDQLMFKGEGCKTLFTTRNRQIVKSEWRYEKQLLEKSYAVPLFCQYAFGQRSIPEYADKNLVREVIAKCDGLPLALQVIGRSLYEGPPEAWAIAKHNLSQGKPVSSSNYHEQAALTVMEIAVDSALTVMATTIDSLEREVKECFLDMGIFSKARKISADLLLDLGVYVHELPLEKAYTILVELAIRNLVKLVTNKKGPLSISYDGNRDLSFIQHDVLRELSLSLTKQKYLINTRKRFIMHIQKGDSICKNAECPSDAEIVSFNTGSMEEKDWCEMKFPNAKALILNFSATEYFLPPFIQSMHKLEVLMIFNHNAKRATLKGVSVFCSLTQLKAVHLEGVIVPPLQEYCQSWQQLQKLSFICDNMIPLHMGLDLLFPRLLEFTIDDCTQLKELPPSICQMTSLQRLSVTNCHALEKLSDEIEKLSSLKMLRLWACTKLKELPNSICKLRELEFLDISFCHGIEQLPEEFGQLSSLKILDMRECRRMKQLPRSADDLRPHLQRVICHKENQLLWSDKIGRSKVEVAENYIDPDCF